MATSNRYPSFQVFEWSKTDPIALLSDVDVERQLKSLTSLLSYDMMQIRKPMDKYQPLLQIEDEGSLLTSAFDYEDLLQFSSLSSSKSYVEESHSLEFDENKKKALLDTIKSTKFEAGEDNAATILFDELIQNKQMKDSVLKYIQGLFIKMYQEGNVAMCVKILTILGYYSYDDLFPYSQAIALASISNESPRVTSASINLFAHWGNKEALGLLKHISEPSEPWIKMKYLSVKKSLEEKCSILEK